VHIFLNLRIKHAYKTQCILFGYGGKKLKLLGSFNGEKG
jgi:hypothetical protein